MNYFTTVALLVVAMACGCFVPTRAFTASVGRPSAFLGPSVPSQRSCQQQQQQQHQPLRSTLKMDVEEPFFASRSSSKTTPDLLQRYNVPLSSHKTQLRIPKEAHQQNHHQQHQQDETIPSSSTAVDEALAQHGLPWKSSIDPSYSADPKKGLFYMPFFEWQIQFMKENLTNLQVLPTESKSGEDLSYIESTTTTAAGAAASGKSPPPPQAVRMVTLCFQSDEYRKIRLTVYDAGNRTQVFTSLWYPAEEYNLPVLGTDLLQFHLDRHLCVVDFQPIRDHEHEHAQPYEQRLKPIRDQYPSLQGQMTKRFYDESRFFSNQMLYSRFEELHHPEEEDDDEASQAEEHPAYRDLFPAYQQYVQTHLDLIRSTPPRPEDVPHVKRGQAAYDTYSADRDPAHAMFTKVFGPAFADAFVYDVLFSFSDGTERAAKAT